MITTIFAVNTKGAFGNFDGSLPWPKNKADMGHFARVTRSIGTVLMGSKTYESICSGGLPPLPKRNAVILSSQGTSLGEVKEMKNSGSIGHGWNGERVIQMNADLPTALEVSSRMFGDIAIIGGSSLIMEGLKYSDEVYMSIIENSSDADIMLDIDIPDDYNCHTWSWLPDFSGLVNFYCKSKLEV